MSDYNMTHTGRELDDAINKVKSGYIQPSGNSPTITSNGTHPVRQYENAVVNVQPSSDYIKKSDTKNYTTQFACGVYRPASETRISDVSITVGFKPKIFFMRMSEGVSATGSKNYVVSMIMVLDNNYSHFSGTIDGSSSSSGGPVSIYYSSSARSGWSQGTANRFTATATGVKGSGNTSSTMYCQSGKGFQWFAWG